MVKVNALRIRKRSIKFRSYGNPICQTCKTETTEVGQVGSGKNYGRFTACRKCDPELFSELERMGLIKEEGRPAFVAGDPTSFGLKKVTKKKKDDDMPHGANHDVDR